MWRDINPAQIMIFILMVICVFAAIGGMIVNVYGWPAFLLAGFVLLIAYGALD